MKPHDTILYPVVEQGRLVEMWSAAAAGSRPLLAHNNHVHDHSREKGLNNNKKKAGGDLVCSSGRCMSLLP